MIDNSKWHVEINRYEYISISREHSIELNKINFNQVEESYFINQIQFSNFVN